MKRYKGISGVILIASVLLIGCKKEAPVNNKLYPDRIVFGSYISPFACGSSEACIEIFSMESGKLMEDINDQVPTAESPYNGNYSVSLSPEKYNQIAEIFTDNIPQELLDAPFGQIGNPQEWSTNFYFEYHRGDYHGHWILDGSFGILPPPFQTFISTVANATSVASN